MKLAMLRIGLRNISARSWESRNPAKSDCVGVCLCVAEPLAAVWWGYSVPGYYLQLGGSGPAAASAGRLAGPAYHGCQARR